MKRELENIRGYREQIVSEMRAFMEVTYYYNEGFNAYHEGNYLRARECLYKALDHQGDNLDVKYWLGRSYSLDDMKEEARGIMRRVRKLSPKEEDNFAINQQDMLTNLYKQVTTTSYVVIFIVGAISLVVGGIGIMNIMLVSVTERIKEIGIRKAVGATKTQIMLHFLFESIVISALGGIIGTIIGVLSSNIPLNLMKLNASVSVFTVFIGLGFSTFVGIVSGMYPAYKAANLNPIDALRHE